MFIYKCFRRVVGICYRACLARLATERSRRLSRLAIKEVASAKITITHGLLPVTVHMGVGSRLFLSGELRFETWMGSRRPIFISLGSGSTLRIAGDFTIGPGCRISLSPDSELTIGGRKTESASGITENTLVMVKKRVVIGTDFICSWDCFITDCNWHLLEGRPSQSDTVIGDHVWVAHGVSILQGARIGDGSVVASRSLVIKEHPQLRALLAGNPARVVRTDVKWCRDILT